VSKSKPFVRLGISKYLSILDHFSSLSSLRPYIWRLHFLFSSVLLFIFDLTYFLFVLALCVLSFVSFLDHDQDWVGAVHRLDACMCWESKALRRISVLFGGSFRKHFWRVGICVIHASGRLFVEFATIHAIQCSSSFLTTVKVTWYRSWGLPLSSISSSHLTFRNPHLTLLISLLLKTQHSVGIRSAPPPLELIVLYSRLLGNPNTAVTAVRGCT
jgi:hypothetical protein